MKLIFLDHDGVICLQNNWGSRYKKRQKVAWPTNQGVDLPLDLRFDNFDKKAIKILNEILEETGAEIVVSSDWRFHATLEEMGHYYTSQGIIKKPIGMTGKSLPSDTHIFDYKTELEETRTLEIKEFLKQHPEVTHWVAIDDLDMCERFGAFTGNYNWGLKNFVLTPKSTEGIKQCGIKEKIINHLK